MSAHGTPEQIRANLSHPVIDGDGHWIEYTPVFAERMRKVVGDKGADGFIASQQPHPRRAEALDRRAQGARHRRWRAIGAGNRPTRCDRATAMLPKMLYDRLDELGIDFGIVYPTAGLGIPRIADDETRRAVIRGFNIVTAEYFAKLSDRLTPAAVIPMHTPEEAIAELEFCIKQLGSKVGMFGSSVARPLPATKEAVAKGLDPQVARHAVLYDQFGLDSDYDYDPVWQKCRELGVAPTFHTGGRGFGLRNNPTQFHLQPYRPFRGGRARGGEGAVPRRRHPALPGSALRLPRRRRRLGLPALRRSDRALGAARRQGHRLHEPRQARPETAAPDGRQIRLRGDRRRTRQARRLAA